MKQVFRLILSIILLLGACANLVKTEGYIIGKQNGNQILVVENITKEEAENTSLVVVSASPIGEYDASFYFVGKETYNKLEKGQRVRVWTEKGQPQMDSYPSQTDAKRVEIIEEK